MLDEKFIKMYDVDTVHAPSAARVHCVNIYDRRYALSTTEHNHCHVRLQRAQ